MGIVYETFYLGVLPVDSFLSQYIMNILTTNLGIYTLETSNEDEMLT